jgi:hypothetical protein
MKQAKSQRPPDSIIMEGEVYRAQSLALHPGQEAFDLEEILSLTPKQGWKKNTLGNSLVWSAPHLEEFRVGEHIYVQGSNDSIFILSVDGVCNDLTTAANIMNNLLGDYTILKICDQKSRVTETSLVEMIIDGKMLYATDPRLLSWRHKIPGFIEPRTLIKHTPSLNKRRRCTAARSEWS